jgi:hypothetical protein
LFESLINLNIDIDIEVTPELLKEVGIDVQSPKTLEEEYESLMKKRDLDNWKNVRAPRPWETDDKQYLDIIEQRIAEQQKKR